MKNRGMKKCFFVLIICFGLTNSLSTFAQLPAFPGAEGFGMYATGGRGGRVIEVTTLEDMNRFGVIAPGSFREALNTDGNDPINIVFKVSGIIELAGELKSSRSNMTISGQTAPGDGICFKDASIKLSGENLIIRYIRSRPGDETKAQVSCLNLENTRNFIIDHCSFSWSIEENMGMYDNVNTTVQWCILSESLYDSYHSKGPRGYASQWGGQRASYHHNLLACHNSRSPRVNGSKSNDTVALCDYRNNVIYNYAKSNSIYGGDQHLFWDPDGDGNNDAGCFVNFVNNYLKPGPAYDGNEFMGPSGSTDPATVGYAEWYINGNTLEGHADITADNWLGVRLNEVGNDIDNIRVTTEHDIENNTTTHTALEAYNLVLQNAGAIKPILDDVDARVIRYVKGEETVVGNGIIDSQSEVGGWPEYKTPVADSIPADTDKDGIPDYWEGENGLDKNNVEDGKIITESGYSNLELYLNADIPYIKPTDPVGVIETTANTKFNISVFPNPSNDFITISSNRIIENVQLFGIDNKAILDITLNNISGKISIEKHPVGVYFLKVTDTNGEYSIIRIIKN